MSVLSTSPEPRQVPHLRLIRDEESPPYDGDPPTVRHERFVKLPPDVLADATLSQRARLLYALLVMHHNAERGCFPSRKTLVKELGGSLPSLDRALAELAERGAIERTHPKPGGLTYYLLPLITGDKGCYQEREAPLITGDNSPLSPVINRTRSNEQDEKNDDVTHARANGAVDVVVVDEFRPTYRDTLGKNFQVAVRMFGELAPELTPGAVMALLCDVERDVGPLPAPVLREGFEAAYEGLKRKLAAERKGGRGVEALKPYARKVIASCLREAQNGAAY